MSLFPDHFDLGAFGVAEETYLLSPTATVVVRFVTKDSPDDSFTEAGLEPRLHANGTNVEGEWDVVMTALKTCHERLHEMGVPRVATNLRLGTRVDRDQSMDAKLESVKEKLKP